MKRKIFCFILILAMTVLSICLFTACDEDADTIVILPDESNYCLQAYYGYDSDAYNTYLVGDTINFAAMFTNRSKLTQYLFHKSLSPVYCEVTRDGVSVGKIGSVIANGSHFLSMQEYDDTTIYHSYFNDVRLYACSGYKTYDVIWKFSEKGKYTFRLCYDFYQSKRRFGSDVADSKNYHFESEDVFTYNVYDEFPQNENLKLEITNSSTTFIDDVYSESNGSDFKCAERYAIDFDLKLTNTSNTDQLFYLIYYYDYIVDYSYCLFHEVFIPKTFSENWHSSKNYNLNAITLKPGESISFSHKIDQYVNLKPFEGTYRFWVDIYENDEFQRIHAADLIINIE